MFFMHDNFSNVGLGYGQSLLDLPDVTISNIDLGYGPNLLASLPSRPTEATGDEQRDAQYVWFLARVIFLR